MFFDIRNNKILSLTPNITIIIPINSNLPSLLTKMREMLIHFKADYEIGHGEVARFSLYLNIIVRPTSCDRCTERLRDFVNVRPTHSLRL